MNNLSHHTIGRHYVEAMRYCGFEAVARLTIADRLAAAETEGVLREARRARRPLRPLILSLGGLLVRLGERLEAAGTIRPEREYA